MSRRFVELVVRARRFVTRDPARHSARRVRHSAHRQIGGELTQFSFRLAFMIDLAYVGIGALGGAVIRDSLDAPVQPATIQCSVADSTTIR